MMLISLCIAFGMGSGALSCGGSSDEMVCSVDDDCPDGQYCNSADVCQGAISCDNDDDCNDGEVCASDGFCTVP